MRLAGNYLETTTKVGWVYRYDEGVGSDFYDSTVLAALARVRKKGRKLLGLQVYCVVGE